MKKLTALFLSLLLLLTLLTACGGSSYDTVATMAAGAMNMKQESAAVEAPAAAPMEPQMNAAADMALTGETGFTGSAVLPENRKWIITVYMDAETEDLETLLTGLEERIAGLNGYVEGQEIYNGSTYSSRRHRSASLTIRIPAADVGTFTEEVAGIANVVSNNLSREDITLTYVATESKVTALKTEEARLLELLAQAENMSDLLEIEARLSDVRYELEHHTSRLRLYDNQVDFATIHLSISEVKEYTPVAEKTVWERIRDGFLSSIRGVSEGFVDFFVWVLASSPYLVVWGLILAVLLFLLRKLKVRSRFKKFSIRKNKE